MEGRPQPSLGLCPVRYTGERPATNMVVIEAKLPSGYIPDKSSMVEVRSPWDTLRCIGSVPWGQWDTDGPPFGMPVPFGEPTTHPELCPSS